MRGGEEEDGDETNYDAAGIKRGGGRIQKKDLSPRTPAKTSGAPAAAKKKRTERGGRIPLQNTRDAIVIPEASSDKVKHPPYVVDMKTRRVSAVDIKSKVTVLREVGDAASRKGAYLMPVAACEWLGLAGTAAAKAKTEDESRGGSSVRLFTFSSPAGLAKFTKQQERELEKRPGRKSRGVVIYL